MNINFIARADKEFRSLPKELQASAKKQFSFLLANINHPSLRAKKYDEEDGVWQGRINRIVQFRQSSFGFSPIANSSIC
ncbi:MAG: hypothetical protein HYT94_01975 [Parcubacteria group bacterium]|nr:hypothetical protein [Parcubacteria group bacterium]